ncbi:WXG100 family type VII secretion target [Nocardia carnea]|uniref:WXG100 family type VII secretion target n=1 Tax=Nocardia carnea TaxID=37328 RepID=A0ABW7TJM6_9NOCA|nr:WXG100 family type VII secretion target [Nocardia carnea]
MKSAFKVDLARLDQLAIHLADLASHLTEQLDLIDDKVANIDGVWEAVAAAAYRDAHALWSVGAREFVTGVTDMSTAAREAYDEYTSAIEFNRKLLE